MGQPLRVVKPGDTLGVSSTSLTMKIAIPLTATDEFSPHYGGSSKFAVIDVDPKERTVRHRTIVVPPEPEPCAWPPLLQAAGVELILAGGMGRGAQVRMAEHGVEVLAGVPSASPDELIAAWFAGRLTPGENACDGSGHGDHHHDDHDHHGGSCHCAH
jgi:predicted Fe-Mo cluster-binding NifX family protein